MARLYEHITGYAEYLYADHSGKRIVDYASTGAKDDPIRMSYRAILLKYTMLTYVIRGDKLCERLLKSLIDNGTFSGRLIWLREIDEAG